MRHLFIFAAYIAIVSSPSNVSARATVASIAVEAPRDRLSPSCLAQMQASGARQPAYDAIECALSWACGQSAGQESGERYERCMQRQADLWLTVDATRERFPKMLEAAGHGEMAFWRQVGAHPEKVAACAEAFRQQLHLRDEASIFDEAHRVPACELATLAPQYEAWLSAVVQRPLPVDAPE